VEKPERGRRRATRDVHIDGERTKINAERFVAVRRLVLVPLSRFALLHVLPVLPWRSSRGRAICPRRLDDDEGAVSRIYMRTTHRRFVRLSHRRVSGDETHDFVSTVSFLFFPHSLVLDAFCASLARFMRRRCGILMPLASASERINFFAAL
jgi:hypothetical protein